MHYVGNLLTVYSVNTLTQSESANLYVNEMSSNMFFLTLVISLVGLG